MRRSCCYAPDILEMLQADLVMLFFYLLLDMLIFFWCKSALRSARRMGKGLARALCEWWSWRAADTFRAFIHLALFAKAVGVSSGINGARGALSFEMGHATSPSCTNTSRVQRATRASRRHDSF